MAQVYWVLLLSIVSVSSIISSSIIHAAPRAGLPDLSLGIVYTSQNSAITENPGAMALANSSHAEFVEKTVSNTWDPLGSLSIDFPKSTIGVSLSHTRSSDVITGALGYTFDTLQVGINVTSPIKTWDETADAGLRLDPVPELSLGLVLHDVFHYNKRASAGLAIPLGPYFKFEWDIFLGRVTGDYSKVDSHIGIEFYQTKKFSLQFLYPFRLMPRVGKLGSRLHVGTHVWVTQKFSVFAIVNPRQSAYSYFMGIGLFF